MVSVVFDEANRELRTVYPYFADSTCTVLAIRWMDGIKLKARIRKGTRLAEIEWDDGTREIISAPVGCSGIIRSRNRRIPYEDLHVKSIRLVALELKGRTG